MSTPKKQALRFTKLEAARRQIITAIWLWFQDADIVSTHTITAAAFGILHDLSLHRKLGRPVPFNDWIPPDGFTPKGFARQVRKMLRADETFFKHARSDPDKTRELSLSWTEMYILSTVLAYRKLMEPKDSLHPLMSLFLFWYALANPDLFGLDLTPFPLEDVELQRIKKLSKIEFFEQLGNPSIPKL